MKHTVRSFSFGLLTAGLITLVVFYIAEETDMVEADLSVDEMIAGLEEEGYRVITENEYISFSLANEEQEEETPIEDTETEEEDNVEEDNAESDSQPADEEAEQEEEQEESAEENEDSNEEAEEVDTTPNTVTVTIESGMPSLDISYMLEELNLIDDAIEFNDYVQVNGYALRIQLGQHELHDEMSYFDIAEELTN